MATEVSERRPTEEQFEAALRDDIEKQETVDDYDGSGSIDEVQALQVQLRDAQEKIASLQRALKNTTATINRLKTEESQISDDQILSKWRSLDSRIEEWCATHFKGPDRYMLAGSIHPNLSSTVRDCNKWLEASNTRPWLIQAYIWRRLEEHIFVLPDRKHLEWVGKYSPALLHLADLVKPRDSSNITYAKDLEKYHKWRAATIGLLQKVESERNMHDFANRLVWDLDETLRKYSSGPSKYYRSVLYDIVFDASRLALDLNKQRALYTVSRRCGRDVWPGPFRAETEDVDVVNDTGGISESTCIVHLVIRPRLRRQGNSDGQNTLTEDSILQRCSVIASTIPERTSSTLGLAGNPSAKSLGKRPQSSHIMRMTSRVKGRQADPEIQAKTRMGLKVATEPPAYSQRWA